jgi:hypothetical protein
VGLPLQLRQRNWRRWLPIIAAVRLVDEILELDGMLIEQVEKYL